VDGTEGACRCSLANAQITVATTGIATRAPTPLCIALPQAAKDNAAICELRIGATSGAAPNTTESDASFFGMGEAWQGLRPPDASF
jgi:hypothetical protein